MIGLIICILTQYKRKKYFPIFFVVLCYYLYKTLSSFRIIVMFNASIYALSD